MSEIHESDLEKLSQISRIKLEDAEKEFVFVNLQKILSYIDQLDELDLDNVPSFTHALGDVEVPLHDDEVSDIMERDEFLKNTPVIEGKNCVVSGMVKVPTIIGGGDEGLA